MEFLWRVGLFYKFINRVDPVIWRLLYRFYQNSNIIVRSDGMISQSFRTTERLEFPFLFNIFIDDLISENVSMNIATKLNDINTSILAYCDDILLLSSNEVHMNSLIKCCHVFSCKLKLEFNASKSISYSPNSEQVEEFVLDKSVVLRCNDFIVWAFRLETTRSSSSFSLVSSKGVRWHYIP